MDLPKSNKRLNWFCRHYWIEPKKGERVSVRLLGEVWASSTRWGRFAPGFFFHADANSTDLTAPKRANRKQNKKIHTKISSTMGGIIDFSTSCPWQLYTFSFLHLIASIFLFFFDACCLLFPTKTGSCVESEVVMSRLLAICLLYTGVIYGVLTYHN